MHSLMADRSSLLVCGLHAVNIRGKFKVRIKKMHKDRGKIRICFFLLCVGAYHWGLGGGNVQCRISVQFVRASEFYDLTVAKDRVPYEGN